MFLRRTMIAVMVVIPIWVLAWLYLDRTPPSYSTEVMMILPGEGAKASVNLDRVGQATSAASSPWASSRLSPVEAYRKLIMTETVHRGAAAVRGVLPDEFPRPRVKLIDQTNFITLSIRGTSPTDAQKNAQSLIDAFNTELENLRQRYAEVREAPNREAIRSYRTRVEAARQAITDFQKETGLISEGQFNERVMMIEQITKRLQGVETELERSEREVDSLKASLGTDGKDAAQALKLRADPIFQSLLTEMGETKIAFERARMSFGEKHPNYLKARRAYASITDAMVDRGRIITRNDEQGFRAIADLATHGQRESMLMELVQKSAVRDGQLATRASLQEQLETVKADVQRLSGPVRQLDHLIREHQVALALFASALSKSDTSKDDQFSAYPLVQVVEVPLANPKPVAPSKKIAILGAGAGSFFVVFGLVLIWMRRKIIGMIGRAFAHPMANRSKPPEAAASPAPAPDAAKAEPQKTRRREPPALDNRALDDEPLIEIPKQKEYGISYSYDVKLRRPKKKS